MSSDMSIPATLILLPGLDGTEVFFRPLLASLPDWITPMVVQFPTAGANAYSDLLRLVRSALAERTVATCWGGRFPDRWR